jgi:predicted ATP-grasp superfamily ATP-dependent carboligase
MQPSRAVNCSTPVVVLAPGVYDTGHGVARTLGRLGVTVYGVHIDRHSPAARSRYWRENLSWPLQSAPPRESVDWLLRLGRRIGSRPMLIATNDASCLLVAEYAVELAQEYRFPTQPPGLALSLSSKQGMYHLCKEHRIPTPETVFPRSRQDVLEFSEGATFPVMLKPIENRVAHRNAGMRMAVIEDAAALLRQYDEMETPEAPNLMIQEYIPGGPDMVWMFNGYFNEDSRCLFGITGKKLRQYPPYTGMTSLGICVPNEAVARQTTDFMAAVGYRGVLDIGYKYDARTEEYKLLDVNPRVGASFRLFVDSVGMDVVQALYLDLTGQPVAVGNPREGRKWLVENYDVVSSLRYFRDGRLSAGEWLRSFRGVEEASWFAWDDLAPLPAMVWRSVARGFERLSARRRRVAPQRNGAPSPDPARSR